jgi:hypothetical protein
MSEATALERSPDSTSIRRWPRYRVNVPIRVIVSRAMKASVFDGRGTSLNEGGMALFAGAELRSGRLSLRGGVSGDRHCPETVRGSTPHASGELCHRMHLASFATIS